MSDLARPNGNPDIAKVGKNTQFNRNTAVKANKKSQEKKKQYKSMREHIAEELTDEDRQKIIAKLKEGYMKYGNLKALDMLMRLSGDLQVKLDVDAVVKGSVEEVLDDI